MEVDQNYTHKYAGNALSRCFTSVPEILGFDFGPKTGVQNSILLISAKVLNQIKREWSHFVSTEPFLQCLVNFPNRPNQKVINDQS